MFRTRSEYINEGDNATLPPVSHTPAIHQAAESIVGFLPDTQDISWYRRDSDGEVIRVVTRDWTTREAAQEWVDYIFANYQVSTTISEVE